mgnify:CR=1 FL=1
MELKRIKNLKQYNIYCELYEDLVFKGYKKDIDKIDLLELLIEDFDNKTIEELGNPKDMEPVELLKYLLEENNLKKSDLARQLNVSRQLITEIVNYKRNISKRMVMKLAERFKIKPAAFGKEYELKSNHKNMSAA